jgi:hypothetical protein
MWYILFHMTLIFFQFQLYSVGWACLSPLLQISLHCEAIRGKMLKLMRVTLSTSNFVANLRQSYNQKCYFRKWGNFTLFVYKANRLGRNSFLYVDYTRSALQFWSCHLLRSLWFYVLQQMCVFVCVCVCVCVSVCLWHKTTQIEQSVLVRSTDRMGTSQNDRCIVFWTTDASKYYILISLAWAKRHNCLPYFTVRDHTDMCHQSFPLWNAQFSTHT